MKKTRSKKDRASPSVIDLSVFVPAYITLIGNRWARSSSALYRKHFGIGIVEWRLMVLLANEPWIQASRVDEVIGMDKGAVSRTARVLAERGLLALRKSAADPRRREMDLTAAGRALHDQIIGITLARENRLLAGLSVKERETLVGFLGKMQANLNSLELSEDEFAAAMGPSYKKKRGKKKASKRKPSSKKPGTKKAGAKKVSKKKTSRRG